MHPFQRPSAVFIISAAMVLGIISALITERWSLAFVSTATLVLTWLPVIFVNRFQIKLPVSFFVAIALFVFATIYLGEALDFYDRYWWWDVTLHGASAIGFGLIGFLFMFMLFRGNRYAAPPGAIAFMAFCFAMTIGASWEIFEFLMDYFFGTNMQKSGLVDTMTDLMVDMAGAVIGATAGYFYLKGRTFGGLSGLIAQFIRLNRRFYDRGQGGDAD